MQNVYGEGRPKGDIGSRGVGLVCMWLRVGGPDDELLSAEEGPEVRVKVFLLPACLAAGGRPEVHRVGCDLDEHQARGTGSDEGHGEEHDTAGVPHAEGAPPFEEPPQVGLEGSAQRVTAGRSPWKSRRGKEGEG